MQDTLIMNENKVFYRPLKPEDKERVLALFHTAKDKNEKPAQESRIIPESFM